MYLYSLGYGTCEESDYRQYHHEKKFTSEALQEIVKECIIETIEHHAGKFNEEGFHNYLHVSESGPTFQHIFDDEFYQQRLASRGFTPVKFEASFSVFGWASAIDMTDWSGHTSEMDVSLQQQIGSACREKGIFVETFMHKDKDETGDGCPFHRLNLMKNIWSDEELIALKLKNEYPFGPKKEK